MSNDHVLKAIDEIRTNANIYRLEQVDKTRNYFNNEINERKKKHNKIIVLAKNKLNKTETLLSNALDDSKISHEEYANITTEKK